VQLAAAHQHRADLGHLAQAATETVGLGVHGQELGLGQGLVAQGDGRAMAEDAPDGSTGALRRP